jgi:hypothetical protein
MTIKELIKEIEQGGRLVVFKYCISLFIFSTKRSSAIYFIKPGKGTSGKEIIFSIITLFFGWWGVPWGPIYAIQSLKINMEGGEDITFLILPSLQKIEGSIKISDIK